MGGDATLGGTGTLTLASVITAGGPTGSSSVVPVITYDAKGRLTTVTTATITAASIGATASVMTTLGDIIYGAPAATRLAGNITSTKNFLSQTGTGTVSAAPVWSTISYSDLTGTPGTFTPAAHVLDSATHTITGKTAGQVLLATAATTYAFTTISGDATLSGTGVLTLTAGAVSLSEMANLAANSIIGNNTGSAATPLALTGTQVTAMLDLFSTTTTTKGLVPGSNNVGATYFLNGSGVWSIPAINVTRFIMNEIGTLSTNTVTLANTPITGKEMIFVNGLLQRGGGNDYTLAGAVVTFTAGAIPQAGDIITSTYIY